MRLHLLILILIATALSSHALVGPSFGGGGSGSSAASSTGSGASTNSTRQGGTSEKEGKKNIKDTKETAPEGPQSKSEKEKILDEIEKKYANAFNNDPLNKYSPETVKAAKDWYDRLPGRSTEWCAREGRKFVETFTGEKLENKNWATKYRDSFEKSQNWRQALPGEQYDLFDTVITGKVGGGPGHWESVMGFRANGSPVWGSDFKQGSWTAANSKSYNNPVRYKWDPGWRNRTAFILPLRVYLFIINLA